MYDGSPKLLHACTERDGEICRGCSAFKQIHTGKCSSPTGLGINYAALFFVGILGLQLLTLTQHGQCQTLRPGKSPDLYFNIRKQSSSARED